MAGSGALCRARIAGSLVFGLNGALAAMWVAQIPVISARTGVDHAALGGLLLAAGLSAFVSMQIFGPLADRLGTRGLCVFAVCALALAIVGPTLVTSPQSLLIALIAFGFFNGALDVSMNSQAVVIERLYRRPIMSSFHAYFSLGGLVGSAVVAAALFAGAQPWMTACAVAAISVVAVWVVAGALIPDRPGDVVDAIPDARTADPTTADPADTDSSPTNTDGRAGVAGRVPIALRVAVMAVLAFSLMLAEGSAYDWSGLHMVERYGVTDAVGAVAFAVFSLTMLVGRLRADAIVARRGAAWVVRAGALIAVVGMSVVICASTPWLSVIGWALFGLGVAAGVPQLFSAAGNLSAASSGRYISIVVGAGYLGMLAGPASIGFVARHTTLGVALWLAAAAAAVAVLGAGVIGATPTPRDHRRRPDGGVRPSDGVRPDGGTRPGDVTVS